MNRQSAGLLLYRFYHTGLEVFLVHPGGPFFKNKDDGFWSIPKGEFTVDENALDAAIREFEEETGLRLTGDFISLDTVRQKGGKVVYAWAIEGNIDADAIQSNSFEIEWPPRSGKKAIFPEVDKAGWFKLPLAFRKINTAQAEFLKRLANIADARDKP